MGEVRVKYSVIARSVILGGRAQSADENALLRRSRPLALLLSPTLEPARAGEAERPARICYFSMNNRKESVQAARFVTKVNEYSEQKFEVRELFDPTEEADPNVALEKACASGLACEGFVFGPSRGRLVRGLSQ